jgi:hypothetical protein
MKPLASNLTDACFQVRSKIKRLKAGHSRPIVVALDGGSGAGKPILASDLGPGRGVLFQPGEAEDGLRIRCPKRLARTRQIALA